MMRNTILLLTLLFLTPAFVHAQKQQECHNDGPNAGNCGPSFSPLSSSGPTTSPIAPLKDTDTRFIENGGNGLDTGCTFRPDGPLVITVPIKRVVGVTNGNGTLQHAAELVNKGLLSPKAKLRMPAFDVDLEGAPGVPPELDFILFNGVQIGSLSGSNNTWKLNEFEVDINQVRFGTRNENGEPTPGNNEITILIDQGSGSDVNWCTAIDWVEITFKAMSPIILVHGNGQKGDFYDKTGFTDFLKSEKLLYDNSIQLPKAPIVLNANRIDQQLQTIVKSFGVDSIHMVAHSKGGPDSRGYLQAFQPFRNSEYKVLSLNTLSSPHDGTILVDLLEQREAAAAMVGRLGRIEYLNFPDYTRQMVALTGLDNGLRSLSTRRMAVFNSDNVAALPPDMAITTVGADADLNLNNQIDRNPDEYGGMRQFNSFLGISDNISSVPGRFAMNSIYQILRNTSRISMECCRTVGLLRRRVATITGTPSGIIIPNDILVTGASAIGAESLQPRSFDNRLYLAGDGRDHGTVANAGVAAQVVEWIIEIERTRGDLK